MRVKICGITQADQAVAIAHLGATALGFICVPASPRYITPEHIGNIGEALKDTIQRSLETVGVFADADLKTLETTVKTGQLSSIQLHGNESPELCQLIRQQLPGIAIIKALRIRSAQDLIQAVRFEPEVDGLLLDAYHPQLLGGTGKTLDWASLQSFHPACPWLLAGGLTPDNVVDALTQLSPDGIDLSSGVEVSPGVKDLDQVKRLFERLRPWLEE
ncbi:phosphoribosylanthranilate isomerase [Pseudanabaena sp. FACHB-2040]|uniref:phosphoribosylanthranilate isomerase n=1 Tax=Pseudanabaena sp. FACHB-2040 TaxID=2692859 RepID=UPI0016840DEC|nr:phosphoribosylanthranilate isomerase [Pseudanabaena sp. FACHB-2040]MBD2257787.1 phosphoribosylanthranilate isomerase [Pseudanabaena sp. FACHB-2040]